VSPHEVAVEASELQALGEAIRALRGPRLSQVGLAARAGINNTYLAGIERGQRNPSWTVVRAIAAGLEIPLAELVRVADTLRDARRSPDST
jgi:transcriptional regulator with XRE-family HTH domain